MSPSDKAAWLGLVFLSSMTVDISPQPLELHKYLYFIIGFCASLSFAVVVVLLPSVSVVPGNLTQGFSPLHDILAHGIMVKVCEKGENTW